MGYPSRSLEHALMGAPYQSGTKDNETSKASLGNSLMVEMTPFSSYVLLGKNKKVSYSLKP